MSTPSVTSLLTEAVKPKETTKIVLGRFSGMLAGFQVVVFRDLKFAGFNAKAAHKIAIDYGSQLGLAMRNDENIKTAVGKANKNSGIAKLSASFHDKLILHNAMAIYRIVQSVEALYKENLVTEYSIVGLKLASRLQEYVSECQLWADTQSWEG